MSDETERDAVEEMLDRLHDEASSNISSCTYRTSFDIFGDMRQRAKQAGSALHYVNGTFFQMDQAQYLLEFTTMRERAIELISLLSDFEQLLKIEADVSVDFFEYMVYQMRPCGYENLAEATGMMEGYNSDGLHDCIAEGLQSCRAVGKLGCINCFREYACDVYLSADDFELARHQCQLVVDHEGEWQARGNRRWLGQNRLAWIDALSGDHESARRGYERALEFTLEEGVSIPLESRFKVLVELDAVRIVNGEEPLLPKDKIFNDLPETGQSPMFDLKRSWNDALQATVAKDYEKAETILADWDAQLRGVKATHYWFETRLRRIAAKRLAGDAKGAESLAETVEERAKSSNDWLTIRRLNELLGDERDPSPLGMVTKPATATHAVPPEETQKVNPDYSPTTEALLKSLNDRLQQAFETRDEETVKTECVAIIDELLAIGADKAETSRDIAGYLGAMMSTIDIFVGDRAPQIWKWANRLAVPHRKDGYIISMLATVGFHLARQDEDPENPMITEDRLRQLFKQSLQLVDDGPGTYFRAGDFYDTVGDVGEAERCFARSFKLNRTNGEVASRLATLYSNTERPRDALHVLDLCLREGTPEPRIAYEAVRLAIDQRQFNATMTYLDRFLEFEGVEDASPLPYFRAIAHLGLGDTEDALKEIDREQAQSEAHWHCHAIRAAASGRAGDFKTAQSSFATVVAQDLRELDYLPLKDVVYLLNLLFENASDIRPATMELNKLHSRLLALGEMPEEYFQAIREKEDVQEETFFFTVLISQELPNWQSSDNCIPGSEHWDHYLQEWGVLAADDDEAVEFALDFQEKCGGDGGQIRVLGANQESGPYTDSPGITFQGFRRYIPLEMMDFDGE